jgi:Helix-turn-helix domain
LRKFDQVRKYVPMPNTNATLTTAQVVEEYGISRRSISRLITDGDLTPMMKLPGHTGAYLFERVEIVRALTAKAAAEATAAAESTSTNSRAQF